MLMLLQTGWQVVAWSIDDPVLGRTTRWGCHNLSLLSLLVSMDGVINYDGIAQELRKSAHSVERQLLLGLGR
jgi:hypothetical protein